MPLLLLTGLLAGCGGAQDNLGLAVMKGGGALESAHRNVNLPAEVPADFVVTPHGYFHPSCVLELGDEERIGDGGDVIRSNGERRALAGCQHPRYDKYGRRVGDSASKTAAPPTVNGWVGSISSTSAGPVKSISAVWRVPSAPSVAGNQTLYFFPGLEPAATGDTILQPVLAWNGFYDSRWTIASWNCCKSGNVFHSSPRSVNPGDRITGTVSGSGCNGAGVCSSWTVGTSSSRGASTTLKTSSYGEVLDWEFGGVVEAYGVDFCNQYPPDGAIAFTSIGVRQTSGAFTTPAWLPWKSIGWSPDCLTSASVDPGGTSVRLTWAVK